MPYRMPRKPGQLDSLHLEGVDRPAVLEALAAEARQEGLTALDPTELVPYGRWLHGDEDPSVRRYLVSPSGPRWTTVLASATDWHHESCFRLAERLGCRALYLMLHDDDVFTLTTVLSPDEVIEHASSPEHFDLPPTRLGMVERVADILLPLCRPDCTSAELVAALTPPGRVDVDGRRALGLVADLLEIPPEAALASYREALEDDGLTPGPAHAGHAHLAFRESLEDPDEAEASPGDGQPASAEAADARPDDDDPPDNLVRFPGPRRG